MALRVHPPRSGAGRPRSLARGVGWLAWIAFGTSRERALLGAETELFGVAGARLPLAVTVALSLLTLSVAACWLPARTAARTPPSEVLRS